MSIIKEIIHCMFDENILLDWAHKENVEVQTFAKQILGKIPNFELLRPKSIPLVEFVDGFDFTLEMRNQENNF